MKKILVPCDFSTPATEAYKVALDVAGRSQGEIVLLHVITLPAFYAAGCDGEPAIYDTASIRAWKQTSAGKWLRYRNKESSVTFP